MISIEKMFETLEDGGVLSKELKEVLDRITSLKNPMKFDDTVATDEQLAQLSAGLEKLLEVEPLKNNFVKIVKELKPVKTTTSFI